MDNNKVFMIKQKKRLIAIMLAIVFLLLIPLISMQFTDDVNWTLFDFIVAAILLTGTGLIYEFAIRRINKIKFRIAIGVVLIAALLIVWAELAVGIFGTPFSGN